MLLCSTRLSSKAILRCHGHNITWNVRWKIRGEKFSDADGSLLSLVSAFTNTSTFGFTLTLFWMWFWCVSGVSVVWILHSRVDLDNTIKCQASGSVTIALGCVVYLVWYRGVKFFFHRSEKYCCTPKAVIWDLFPQPNKVKELSLFNWNVTLKKLGWLIFWVEWLNSFIYFFNL